MRNKLLTCAATVAFTLLAGGLPSFAAQTHATPDTPFDTDLAQQAAAGPASAGLLPTFDQSAPAQPFGLSAFVLRAATRSQEELIKRRFDLETQLEKLAVIDRKVMIPMRDGKRMYADVYRPKDAKGPVPTILVRTPYNFNFWDVRLGAPADMSRQLYAVKHGYAYAEIEERGHTFSEGNYDILGMPRTDGYDEIKWLTTQPWSNGKLAPTGCSSTAEWQSGVVALNPPGLVTFNPRGFGAGVGRVGPYYEQGNWYRGGALRMLFIDWIYAEQNQVRPMFPADTTQQQLIEASKMFDLEPAMPPVDWQKALWHLPVSDIIKAVGGPPGIYDTEMPVATGGNMAARYPNDPAWYKGGLWNDSEPINKPGLWFMTWFDVSMSPNLAEYNYVRRTAPADVADQQYLVIAPGLHCQYYEAANNPVDDYQVGQLDVDDARYAYNQYMYDWFDHFLKGDNNGVLQKHPKVMYYLMGKNEWKDSPSWPPPGAQPETFYLSSAGHANTMYGDGLLTSRAPGSDRPDQFVYDPLNPVPSVGGGGCCLAGFTTYGAWDQRQLETRNDILVYTTPTLKQGMEVSGPITLTLYVSSDARDTDFTFKVMDVYPDGKALNITENIQRMRWREGYDHAPVWMQPGKVYKVTFQPIDIGYYFKSGHKLRLSVSSSNFPRYDRNLNTGLNNQTTSETKIAHNAVHHDGRYPSVLELTVLPAAKERPTDPYHAARDKTATEQ